MASCYIQFPCLLGQKAQRAGKFLHHLCGGMAAPIEQAVEIVRRNTGIERDTGVLDARAIDVVSETLRKKRHGVPFA
jgi:hypothetical protein